MAVRMLGELGDRAYSGALLPLLSKNPVELRVAAAEALARLGDQRGLAQVLDACRLEVPIRAQAALALGCFNGPRAGRVRVGMLDDEAEVVRLAAAAAIIAAAGPE
jgi:HEAT repeat protein